MFVLDDFDLKILSCAHVRLASGVSRASPSYGILKPINVLLVVGITIVQ